MELTHLTPSTVAGMSPGNCSLGLQVHAADLCLQMLPFGGWLWVTTWICATMDPPSNYHRKWVVPSPMLTLLCTVPPFVHYPAIYHWNWPHLPYQMQQILAPTDSLEPTRRLELQSRPSARRQLTIDGGESQVFLGWRISPMEAIQKGEHDMGLLTLLLVFENQKKKELHLVRIVTDPSQSITGISQIVTDCNGPVTISDTILILTEFSVTIFKLSVIILARTPCTCHPVTILFIPTQFSSQIVTEAFSVKNFRHN